MSSYMRRTQLESRRNKQIRIAEQHNMQIECNVCKCRTFYLMAQEDGSIESYCAVHNHKRMLVNIPELVSHVLKGQNEDEGTGSPSGTTNNSNTDKHQSFEHDHTSRPNTLNE